MKFLQINDNFYNSSSLLRIEKTEKWVQLYFSDGKHETISTADLSSLLNFFTTETAESVLMLEPFESSLDSDDF